MGDALYGVASTKRRHDMRIDRKRWWVAIVGVMITSVGLGALPAAAAGSLVRADPTAHRPASDPCPPGTQPKPGTKICIGGGTTIEIPDGSNPPPITITCPDGTVIQIGGTCPTKPPTTPQPPTGNPPTTPQPPTGNPPTSPQPPVTISPTIEIPLNPGRPTTPQPPSNPPVSPPKPPVVKPPVSPPKPPVVQPRKGWFPKMCVKWIRVPVPKTRTTVPVPVPYPCWK